MTGFNYGDIIEYKDETYDPNFEEARSWAYSHNTTFEELVDRREEKEEEEQYTVMVEKEITVPAKTHEETIPAEYDEDNKLIKEEEIVTVVDEEEHTETVTEEKEQTRKIKVLYRYFQIGQEYVPTEDEMKAQMLSIRDNYFAQYVDWYQSKPLLWEEMEETEKENIRQYRQYLKDYNDKTNWWKKPPMDYDTWLNKQ